MRWAARTYKLEDNSAIIRDLLPARNGVPGPSTTLGFEHAGQEGSPLGLNPLCNFVSFVVVKLGPGHPAFLRRERWLILASCEKVR